MAQFNRGDIVDRYRLEERLGAGTFGEVWRADQLTQGQDIGRPCAIKLMRLARDGRSDTSADEVASGWLDEVRALQLAKNRRAGDTIPEIYDANVWQGHAYIAMELLGGRTIAARLEDGPIPWRRALFIGAQIAQALEAVHAEGIIHRDLKPQNVVLVDAERACVIDWGIARLSSPAQQARGTAPAPDVVDGTEAEPPLLQAAPRRAQLIGTPGYIAPEAYEGALPTPALDVFSLGVVLYEMLSGQLPQDVEPIDRTSSNADSVRSYRNALDRATQDLQIVPLRTRCPHLPESVLALVESLIDPVPEKRPRRVREAFERVNRYPFGIPDPPFVGLGKLGREHAGLFFGQDDAIDNALVRLESQRAILLWGPSGSGKSSLAVAGVAASADRRLFLGMDGWTISIVRPREAQTIELGELTPSLTPRSDIGHLVVIDQLEEVVDLEPAARDAFCEAVLALLDGTRVVKVGGTAILPQDTVRIVATIRDDIEWRVDREVSALRPLLERRVIVKGVDANYARSIIAEPARAAGFEVEELDSVSREVEDRLSADASRLPVVQFALSEWWERRDRTTKKLPIAAWRELGGVDGTLSFVAERFYTRLAPAEQQRVHEIFLRFFSGSRRRALAAEDIDAADRKLVDELVRLRLIGRRERKGEAPFYEVEHESLTRNWQRLSSWLEEAREDRALYDELERDATAWNASRESDRLWKKRRLIAGEDLVRRGHERPSDIALEFLRSGRAAARRGVVALAVLAGVIVAIVAIVVVWQLDKVTKARNLALKSEALANAAKLNAEDSAREAKQRADEAKAAELVAKSAQADAEEAKKKVEATLLDRNLCKDTLATTVSDADALRKLTIELETTKKKLEDQTKLLAAEIQRKQAGISELDKEELRAACKRLNK